MLILFGCGMSLWNLSGVHLFVRWPNIIGLAVVVFAN